MGTIRFDEFMPADFDDRTSAEAKRGRVPFVILRPDRGEASPPEPIAVVFGPCVPRVGETLLWDNGETYAVVGVTHRLATDEDALPYLASLPLIATRPLVERRVDRA